MSVSFFDLMKYASTGIASPDMTAYDKMRALAAFGGGKTRTLTGVPPLSFKADGTPLISWSMKGNGQQSGTPSPQSIIVPEFCGERIRNLFYPSATQSSGSTLNIRQTTGVSEVVLNKSVSASDTSAHVTIDITLQAGTYIISVDGLNVLSASYDRCLLRDTHNNIIVNDIQTNRPKTFTISETVKLNRLTIVADAESVYTDATIRFMLNSGSTALPYEPYGYKIPLTCAGQTVPVYLGQTQTARKIRKLVFDGTEEWFFSYGSFRIVLSGYLRERGWIPFCSHYKGIDFVASGDSLQNGETAFLLSNSGNNFLYICDTSISTVADFKAYLAAQYAAGTPVTVWYVLEEPKTAIVNEPLAKIGDYADELSSEDAGVRIPTMKGVNTLTVDTELQPSSMTITGNIKEI